MWKGFLRVSRGWYLLIGRGTGSDERHLSPAIVRTWNGSQRMILHPNIKEAFARRAYASLQTAAEKIRWLRLQTGMTQAEAARALGMERSAYANYEAGRIERFDLNAMERMSHLYRVPVNDLLDEYNAFLQSGQGQQMLRWRTSLGLSRKGMARRLGVAVSNIDAWEKEEKIMTKALWERCFKEGHAADERSENSEYTAEFIMDSAVRHTSVGR